MYFVYILAIVAICISDICRHVGRTPDEIGSVTGYATYGLFHDAVETHVIYIFTFLGWMNLIMELCIQCYGHDISLACTWTKDSQTFS